MTSSNVSHKYVEKSIYILIVKLKVMKQIEAVQRNKDIKLHH